MLSKTILLSIFASIALAAPRAEPVARPDAAPLPSPVAVADAAPVPDPSPAAEPQFSLSGPLGSFTYDPNRSAGGVLIGPLGSFTWGQSRDQPTPLPYYGNVPPSPPRPYGYGSQGGYPGGYGDYPPRPYGNQGGYQGGYPGGYPGGYQGGYPQTVTVYSTRRGG